MDTKDLDILIRSPTAFSILYSREVCGFGRRCIGKIRNTKDGGSMHMSHPSLWDNSQSSAFNSQAGKYLSPSSGSTDACAQLRFATAENTLLFEKAADFV